MILALLESKFVNTSRSLPVWLSFCFQQVSLARLLGKAVIFCHEPSSKLR